MQNFFYATEKDEDSVWEMVFAIPGLRVYEASTNEPRDLREYTTPQDIRAAQAKFPAFFDVYLFPSTIGASLDIELRFDENGEIIRRRIDGWIPASFARYAPVDGCLSYCNITAWNGPSSAEIENFPEIDWKKRMSLFRKLKRQIEKAAPAKAGGIPVLPDAFEKLRSGELNLWGYGEPISISSPLVVIKDNG